MSKEVLDNEKLKKAKKSWEWIYSEEAWNVLKAKTPEEEYIVNREVEINEMKGKIEENKNAIKETEKKLASREEEKEIEKKIIEEFSIKKLSEFLSEDELEILKKWRERSELDGIIEERRVDPLKDLINKIFEWVKDFPLEEKLVIASYLQNKHIMLLGMGGTFWFYYTDFPDEIVFADKVKSNLRKLWLDDFVDYIWDSCYKIDYNVFNKAKEKIRKENLPESDKKVQFELDKLKEEWNKMEKKLESIEERKNAVQKYGLPEKEAISLYQWSENLEWVHDEFYDKENHTLVVLHEYSDYNGSGGTEYWTIINVKRGKNTTKKSFKYRDRYDYRNDNPKHEYKKIKGVKVDWDKVEVTVSKGKSTDTYTFDIAYKEDKKSLNSAEDENFEESIRKVEESLIIENTKDQKYLASHNLALRKVPGAFDKDWMSLESELSYDKAKVVYENIIPEEWEAHVTILMQKDASWDMWRQFWLIKYIVTPEWAEKVEEYFYWELNQIEWNVDNEKMKEFKDW